MFALYIGLNVLAAGGNVMVPVVSIGSGVVVRASIHG